MPTYVVGAVQPEQRNACEAKTGAPPKSTQTSSRLVYPRRKSVDYVLRSVVGHTVVIFQLGDYQPQLRGHCPHQNK
ncbi:hypothetical protein NECAME_09949 [Necator americanus]|uniref:Uncharacterized protein n=1 Tax=Necator americanus TaxID=51031 RepID=W2TC56_NECAM|nr:hypothetical protein NECAME_09949 [Necator americanus]ETN79184.1 hypothetical protein NECAME_09949 [Necator americanus]